MRSSRDFARATRRFPAGSSIDALTPVVWSPQALNAQIDGVLEAENRRRPKTSCPNRNGRILLICKHPPICILGTF